MNFTLDFDAEPLSTLEPFLEEYRTNYNDGAIIGGVALNLFCACINRPDLITPTKDLDIIYFDGTEEFRWELKTSSFSSDIAVDIFMNYLFFPYKSNQFEIIILNINNHPYRVVTVGSFLQYLIYGITMLNDKLVADLDRIRLIFNVVQGLGFAKPWFEELDSTLIHALQTNSLKALHHAPLSNVFSPKELVQIRPNIAYPTANFIAHFDGSLTLPHLKGLQSELTKPELTCIRTIISTIIKDATIFPFALLETLAETIIRDYVREVKSLDIWRRINVYLRCAYYLTNTQAKDRLSPETISKICIIEGIGQALLNKERLRPNRFAEWEKEVCNFPHLFQHPFKDQLLQIISEYRQDGVVADFGCGEGKWLASLASAKTIYAIAPDSTMLDQAKQCAPHNTEFFNQQLGHLTLPQPVDFALCFNAILPENHRNALEILKSIFACLADHGRIIITLPSLESLIYTENMLHFEEASHGREAFSLNQRLAHWLEVYNNPLGYVRRGENVVKYWMKDEFETVLTLIGTMKVLEYKRLNAVEIRAGKPPKTNYTQPWLHAWVIEKLMM